MITDNDLYSLAIFLGSLSMLLIVLYHFLEVNAKDDDQLGSTSTSSSSKHARMIPEKRARSAEVEPTQTQQGGIKGKEKITAR